MEEVFEASSAEQEIYAASVRERLKAAMKEVKGHTAPERPAHDPGAR